MLKDYFGLGEDSGDILFLINIKADEISQEAKGGSFVFFHVRVF